MAFIAQDHTRYGPYSIAYIIWVVLPNSETSLLRAESLVQSNFGVFILKKIIQHFIALSELSWQQIFGELWFNYVTEQGRVFLFIHVQKG